MDFESLLAAADRQVIQTLGKPASAITYQPGPDDPAANVAGIFDAAYVRVEVGEAGVASVAPAVFFRLVDLPADPDDADDALITIDGVAYIQREVKKDGQGGVWIVLRLSPQ